MNKLNISSDDGDGKISYTCHLPHRYIYSSVYGGIVVADIVVILTCYMILISYQIVNTPEHVDITVGMQCCHYVN